MCVKTAINAQFKKINRKINAIKEINRLTVVIFTKYDLPMTFHF